MEKLGLLAGVGHLPAACARAARAQGFEVHAVALLPDCDPELKDAANAYREISIGSIASILAYLQQEKIQKVTMIGKVTKELLFTGAVQPDEMLRGMLMQLPNQNDDTIMMMRLPSTQLCATWVYAISRQSSPMRVSSPSPVARCTVAHSRIVVRSPMNV